MMTADNVFEAVSESAGRKTDAFALIQEVLKASALDRRDVDCIAVGLGPGSYTGVRVGISIAQGWQIATGVKLLGVSSADAIAEQARSEEEMRGPVTCVIDAQRQEFYVAAYELQEEQAHATQPLRIETLAQIQERAARGEALIGPDALPVSSRTVYPTALAIGDLARGHTDFVSGEKLEPIYLRKPAFVKAPPPRFSSP